MIGLRKALYDFWARNFVNIAQHHDTLAVASNCVLFDKFHRSVALHGLAPPCRRAKKPKSAH